MKIAYQSERVTLYQGDCLEVLPTLAAGVADMVCADPPYGFLENEWDFVIPPQPMWDQLKRVIGPRAAVVMTAAQPFTSLLVASNVAWFRHSWVWDKGSIGNFQLAKVAPLREHEDILVFAQKGVNYYPQMTPREKPFDTRNWKHQVSRDDAVMRIRSGNRDASRTVRTESYPRSIIRCNAVQKECNGNHRIHPTQKPVALMSYLIRTYTNEDDTVLDFCCGSGTTGVAALECGRRAILIEREPAYVAIAAKRLAEAKASQALFDLADRNTAAPVAPSLF